MPADRGGLDPKGPVAETMAELWWLMLALGALVFVGVVVLLVLGLFRGRRDVESTPTPDTGRSSRWLIGGGVVMPVLVLVVVFGATVAAMRDVPTEAPAGALVVEVIGHQWWWEVRYPEEGITTANELHVPVGRAVSIELTSADVIHSFWVPALGGKLDALPDGTNTLVLEADEPGEFHSECAEFCGLQHANMAVVVVAESQDRFASWVDAQRGPAAEPGDATAQRGREVFLGDEAQCAACHTVRGTAADATDGPDLTHVGSRPTIGAGTLSNTPMNLADWVRNPHTAKDGVGMPASSLTDEQLEAVVAYLETLE